MWNFRIHDFVKARLYARLKYGSQLNTIARAKKLPLQRWPNVGRSRACPLQRCTTLARTLANVVKATLASRAFTRVGVCWGREKQIVAA